MGTSWNKAPAWGPVQKAPAASFTPPQRPAPATRPATLGGLGGGLQNNPVGQRMQQILGRAQNARGAPTPTTPAVPAAPSTPAGGGNPMGGDVGPLTSSGDNLRDSGQLGGGSPQGDGLPPNTPFYGAKGGSVPGYAKGGAVKNACYAQGGPVTGRSRSFVKGDDEFRTGKGVPQNYRK